MRTCIIIITALTSTLNNLYGQNNLNESIVEFNSNCSEPVIPEDTIVAEFTLLELSFRKNTTTLNFEIIANCAQKQKGQLTVFGDSLKITETDVTVTTETHYETDSLGNELEVTTETHIADYVFCDCLVNFNYQLSTRLDNVNFLTFHERTFKLAEKKKKAR